LLGGMIRTGKDQPRPRAAGRRRQHGMRLSRGGLWPPR
jgi:hypothetical protein